jgi:hypothetical protein
MSARPDHESASPTNFAVGLLTLIALDGLLALVLHLRLHWPLLSAAIVPLIAIIALVTLVGVLVPEEPVVILSQLPDDLREPLEPFIKRGRETLTVPEIRQFYRAAAELMEERTDLAHHQAALINSMTALELATAIAEFVNSLAPEERSLLEYRRRG